MTFSPFLQAKNRNILQCSSRFALKISYKNPQKYELVEKKQLSIWKSITSAVNINTLHRHSREKWTEGLYTIPTG